MKDDKPKQKFVVQRMLGVEADTPEQAVEMTTVKTSGVTSLSLNVQPTQTPPTPPPLYPSDQPTPAMEKQRAGRVGTGPKHSK